LNFHSFGENKQNQSIRKSSQLNNSFQESYNVEVYKMLINCIKCLKHEDDGYLSLIQQFLSLEYKENALKILSDYSIHIFDRLMFLKRFRSVNFKKYMECFIENRKNELSLETIIFLFREKDLIEKILQNFLGKSDKIWIPLGI
jgi:hypothetical protein